MTTYTALSDTDLQLDKPVTQLVARAGMRDNLASVLEGDASAPHAAPAALSLPYFKAVRTTDQTASPNDGQWAKLTADTEVYDPSGLYDNVTNYRFTPNKAGIYLCGAEILVTAGLTSSTDYEVGIGKNGTPSTAFGDYSKVRKSGGTDGLNTFVCHTSIVQMNGTTDYLEAYWAQIGNVSQSMTVRGAFWAIALGRL